MGKSLLVHAFKEAMAQNASGQPGNHGGRQ